MQLKKYEYRLNDDELFESLMTDYGEELTRMAFLYLKDWSLAEDAVQEAFIKLYGKLDTFRGESSLKTWLYSILINTCKDLLRRAKYRKLLFFHTDKTSIESTELTVLYDEAKTELAASVLKLPLQYREVMILFYYQSFSTREISELLSISESAVRVRLNRGREKLRKSWRRESHEI